MRYVTSCICMTRKKPINTIIKKTLMDDLFKCHVWVMVKRPWSILEKNWVYFHCFLQTILHFSRCNAKWGYMQNFNCLWEILTIFWLCSFLRSVYYGTIWKSLFNNWCPYLDMGMFKSCHFTKEGFFVGFR